MTRLSTRAATALLGALLATTTLTAPAHAQEVEIVDPAGDAANPGLDVTSVTLNSLDRTIVVTATFTKVRRGDLIVSIDPRGRDGVRLVSERAKDGTTTDAVLPGAFTDKGIQEEPAALDCPGYRVSWVPKQKRVQLVLPASCLNGGNYGAVRFGYLTERGADTDFGPQDEDGFLTATDWIPRG
jgi:hypothetical protein